MWFYAIVIVAIVFDQATKYWVVNHLINSHISIITDVLQFIYVTNTGAAFSILQNGRWFFLIITPLVCGFLLYLYIKNKTNTLQSISFALIIGGALGNLMDRIRLGYVVDFIDFKVWPVFNFADSCIVIGAVLYILDSLFLNQKNEDENETSRAKN